LHVYYSIFPVYLYQLWSGLFLKRWIQGNSRQRTTEFYLVADKIRKHSTQKQEEFNLIDIKKIEKCENDLWFRSEVAMHSVLAESRGSLRDVVHLGRPLVLSYMIPNAGESQKGVAESQPMSTAVQMEPKETLET
jgi:hypothetical protein